MKRILVFLLIASTVACAGDPKEKVTTLITAELEACKKATGDFHEVRVMTGKAQVLRETCQAAMKGLVINDEFTAEAMVGPYKWLAGVDDASGVWMLSGIEWNTLDRAVRATKEKETPVDARTAGEKLWAEAQAEAPESGFVRYKRFHNLLMMRQTSRGKTPNPTELDTNTQKIYDELTAWGAGKETDAAMMARYDVVRYFRDYLEKLDISLESIGGQDEWLEATIKQAKKDGNTKDVEKYEQTLAASRATRDKDIAEVEGKQEKVKKRLCAEVGKLVPSKLKDEKLSKRAANLKSAISCP